MTRQEQIEVAVVLFAAILCLTGSFWKAILVGVIVLVACILGFGRHWLLGGSFAIAIVAIAVVLGAPSRDQWLELWQDARRAFSVWLPGY
jgi:O-antigen ligase